jgi:Cof subfamily protein (haloacid dehalogenase superfamily)
VSLTIVTTHVSGHRRGVPAETFGQDGIVHRPRLIASDVDGTLLDARERVSKRTARVVARVIKHHTPFVLVTGRPPRWIPPVASAIRLTGYAVCANGAVLYDIGMDRIIRSYLLESIVLHDVVHALDAVVPGITVATERPQQSLTDRSITPFASEPDFHNPWGDEESRVVPRAEVLGHPAMKLLIRHRQMTSNELAEATKAVVRDAVDVTYSTNRGLIEISAAGITKATGLAETASVLNIDAADVIAFGDMPNDLPMLTWAGHGVAMANAHPELRSIADEITAANTEDGVAQVLERWF